MVQDNGPRDRPPSGLFEMAGAWRGPPLAGHANVTSLAARWTTGRHAERRAAIRILLLGEDAEGTETVRLLLEHAGSERYVFRWLVEPPLDFRLDGTSFDLVIVMAEPALGSGMATFSALRAAGLTAPIVLASAGVEDDLVERAVDLGVADVLDATDLDLQTLDRTVRAALARASRDRQLYQAVRRDDLTGLANRASFRDRLDHGLTLARRSGSKLALLLVDVDDFKSINDRFGHPGGDELLRRVGERLRSRVRESDTVARLGGDEFGVLLLNIARPEDAAVVVRKLLEALKPPIDLDGQPAQVTASIGVAIYPDHALEAQRLIRLADAAMYRAKRADGGGCCWHDDSRPLACPDAEELAAAMATDAVSFVLRPQVALRVGRVAMGMRPVWRHPRQGLLDLLAMRTLLEEAGVVEQLTERLLLAAAGKLAEWQRHGFGEARITLPMLSRRRLAWAGLADRMAAAASRQSILPERLEIEIDEQLLVEDAQTGGQGAAAFARAGVPVALDRFGAGTMAVGLFTTVRPSSIRLCPTALDADGPADRLTLFQAITALAHRLQIHSIATGADSPRRMEQARRIGVGAIETAIACLPADDPCLPWLRIAMRRAV
ncbi:GGDEF domain-containing protein [Geminicoccus harenae]|uniref:GGDEF domain-containing protein n=3 Tax=Geminicoccus harenae TaxID=2498453 RepID=UPI001C97D076|nr:diguanylate cyclase [Geminicoccus harenae]